MTIKAINWNKIEDEKDAEVWGRMTSNFWLPEKIALSNDINSWSVMPKEETEATIKVFTGLTMLDTLQSSVGAVSLMEDAVTPHEEACLTFIAAMESIHAKSYSSVFSTLCTSTQIEEAFAWAENNNFLQKKSYIVKKYYDGKDPVMKKVASVFLESFLFYSGFYLPLRLSARSKITNTADIIKLIIADEAVHGYYIGYKFQRTVADFSAKEKEELKVKVDSLFQELFDIEVEYTQEIYGELGWQEDVIKFLKYNGNKAMMNLGYDEYFPPSECKADPSVIAALTTQKGENHDFFSGAGSSYVMGKAVDTDDEDWNF